MLDPVFISVAIALRLWAGVDYFVATLKGQVKPNPVTWLFWGLAPLVAFAAQAQHGLEPASWVTFVLGLGPLLIFGATLTKNKRQRWKVSIFDVLCGASAAIGIVLWQATNDPAMALTFGIIADILGGIPTVYKAYARPDSEKAFPYFLSLCSMIVTLLTIQQWNYLTVGFPAYIFCINALIAGLIFTRVGVKRKKRSK
jgi:hypothetical protein